MFPFSQDTTPVVQNYLDAQLSFFNALSKSVFGTIQQYNGLNIQLVHTLLEEGAQAGQQVLLAKDGAEKLSALAAHLQPTAGKVRAYQQHITRLASDTQVDLADVSEKHITETSRTAKELANEVRRVASEETDKTLRDQQEAVRGFTDPFKEVAEAFGAAKRRGQKVDREEEEAASHASATQAPPPATAGKAPGARA